jgi:hypothetical protein
VQQLISTLQDSTNEAVSIIERCKDLLASLELDMEKKELEVRRQVFEAELRYILFPVAQENSSGKKRRKIDIDEFKMTYEKDFETLKNILQDEDLDVKFTNLRN